MIPYVEPGTENSYYTITSFETKNSNPNLSQNPSSKMNNSSSLSSTNVSAMSEKSKAANKQRLLALYQRMRDSDDTSKGLNKSLSDEKMDSQGIDENSKRPRSRAKIREITNIQIQESKTKNSVFIDQPSISNLIANTLRNSNTNNNNNNNKPLGKIKNLNKHLQTQHQEYFYPDANPNESPLKEKHASKKQQNDLEDIVKTKDSSKKVDLTDNNKKSNKNLSQHEEENSATKRNIHSPSFLNVINHRIKFQVAN